MNLSTKIEKILSKSLKINSKFENKITKNSQFSILHTHLENAVHFMGIATIKVRYKKIKKIKKSQNQKIINQ